MTSWTPCRRCAEFHATTLAWAYIDDPSFISRVTQSGRVFGGAAAAPSYSGPKDGDNWLRQVAILNRRGEVIIAPWKRTWKPTLWGCLNNPRLERGYLDYLKRYIDAGAQVMQRDEPGGNRSAVEWGGCFCDHCMSGFRNYLANHTTPEQQEQLGISPLDQFDYRDRLERVNAPIGDAFGNWDGGPLKELFHTFQSEATVAFHRRARAAMDAHAGRRVPFSCNNGVRKWGEIELEFDWAFGELSYRHATAEYLYEAMRTAAANDRAQIVTMPKKGDRLDMQKWTRLTRQTIAMAYACGGHCMVPWDVYMPRDAPRYFGTAEQYADLFGFIRASSRYFDGFQQAEATGYGVPVRQQADADSVHLVGGEKVHVNVRAQPGKRDEAVVIQLVDWADHPQPFSLVLNPSRFFGEQPLRIRLLEPTEFEKAAHEAADRTSDYRALAKETVLAEGRIVTVDIPALSPWGIVVVEPMQSSDTGVWQPAVRALPDSRFHSDLVVRIDSATPDATIHYTLDGAAPDQDSPRYVEPLTLAKSSEIRAIAVANSMASAVTRARFDRIDAAGVPIAPDADSLKPNLKLWLNADSLAGMVADGDQVTSWPARFGPAATVPTAILPGGLTPDAPTYCGQSINGHATIRFDGVDDQLFIDSFANEHLAGSPFTIFLVTRSESEAFGICGNSATGDGGVPRLYLTRGIFRYDDLDNGLEPRVHGDDAAVSVFIHDGAETIAAWVNGESRGQATGLEVVPQFGGGHLAMPFRGSNQGQAGEIVEVIVYSSRLNDSHRRSIESWLADRYHLPVPRWR